jgi:peptidoglycan/LPS O-acetylase OafA/YrhL
MLLLFLAGPDALVGRALALKPLAVVGLMSYSNYLLHQPIRAYTKHMSPGYSLSSGLSSLLLAGKFFVSYSTRTFVGTPFRPVQTISNKTFMTLYILIAVALTAVATVSYFSLSIWLG